MFTQARNRALLLFVLVLALGAVAAACGDESNKTTSAPGATDEPTEQVTLNLGYFPNITHATPIVGVEKGIYAATLGTNVTLKTQTFNAGPEATEAIFAGAVDAQFIGPNPAINAYAKSDGKAIRIVSGSTSGGAFFVVKDTIDDANDLKGKKIATPQLGNTQDVALRGWLKDQGLSTDTTGGGDLSILPQENADTLNAFKAGEIDGAWVPEPWATRLLQEGGDAKVLVDERSLWPEGKYVTTHLIVRTEYLNDHPDVIKRLIEGQVEATRFVNEHGAEARTIVNDGIEKVTGKRIADSVIAAAWPNLIFTTDPIASSLAKSAESAEAVGLLDPVELDGIYDLKLLNQVLQADGGSAVSGL
jgi:NitT/TauT family transport system substrate-binding protein